MTVSQLKKQHKQIKRKIKEKQKREREAGHGGQVDEEAQGTQHTEDGAHLQELEHDEGDIQVDMADTEEGDTTQDMFCIEVDMHFV